MNENHFENPDLVGCNPRIFPKNKKLKQPLNACSNVFCYLSYGNMEMVKQHHAKQALGVIKSSLSNFSRMVVGPIWPTCWKIRSNDLILVGPLAILVEQVPCGPGPVDPTDLLAKFIPCEACLTTKVLIGVLIFV